MSKITELDHTVSTTATIAGIGYVWDGDQWVSTGLPPASLSLRPNAIQTIVSQQATVTPLALQAASGQTADVFQVLGAGGNPLVSVGPAGGVTFSGRVNFATTPTGVVSTDPKSNAQIIEQTNAAVTPLGIHTVGTGTLPSFELTSGVGKTLKQAFYPDGSARFIGLIAAPTAPTANEHLTNKAYVDAESAKNKALTVVNKTAIALNATHIATNTAGIATNKAAAAAAHALAVTKITQAQGDARYLKRTTDTFRGNLTVSGWIHATSDIWAYSSDRAIKDHFESMPNDCLDRNQLMKGMTFTRKDIKDDNDRRYAGLIAQDIEAAIPEATNRDDRGVLRYDPNAVMGHMVNCINELTNENTHLKARVAQLEEGLERLIQHIELGEGGA